MAGAMGLRSGWSLDITTRDTDGRPRNFNEIEMRNRAVRRVIKDQPLFLIGSPMCTVFSTMNRINYVRMAPEEVQERMAYGKAHLEFCAKLYAIQGRARRYVLHGHPAEAISRQENCIKEMLQMQGVIRLTGDQCRYGLQTYDGYRKGPAMKRTGSMANSICVAQMLEKICPNKPNRQVHEHVSFEDGRTKVAQAYPPALCRAICEGMHLQVEADRNGEFLIANIDTNREQMQNN